MPTHHRALPSLKAFTLVELLIVLAILAVLSLTTYFSLNRSRENSFNAKILSDLTAIQNALDRYKQDNNGSYPLPDPNQVSALCFTPTATYTHDCNSAFFLQTPLTVQILGPRYLPKLPSDPRTGSPYLYGVTYDGASMQVAASYWDKENETWIAKTTQYFTPDFPLNSLIRSYNSPNFVVPNGLHLPYSPHSLQISAQLLSFGPGTTLINNNNQKVSLGPDPNLDPQDPNNPDPNNPYFNPNLNPDSPLTLQEGDTLTVPQGQRATLYFSDGSVSTVGSDTSPSTLQILAASQAHNPNSNSNDPNSPNPPEDQGPVTKIFLKLTEGRIFNKVTRLSQASEFNIQTTSSIAGVRGTEFGLEVGTGENKTDRLYLYSGSVSVRQKTEAEKEQESLVLSKADLNQELWTVTKQPADKLLVVDITSPGLTPDNQPLSSFQTPSPQSLPPNLLETLMKEYYPETVTQTVSLTTTLKPLVLEVNSEETQVRLQLNLPNTFSTLSDPNNPDPNNPDPNNPDPNNLNTLSPLPPQMTHALVCPEPVAQTCETQSPKACNLAQNCLSFPLPEPEQQENSEEKTTTTFTYLVQTPDLFIANPDPTQNPKRFALADLTDPNHPLLSAFSLPALFIDSNTQLTPQDIDSYGLEVIDISPDQTDPLKDDPQVKCEVMGTGVWKDGACWVLGAEDQSCTDACIAFGEEFHLPTLTCDPGQWNDTLTCEICQGLLKGVDIQYNCGQSGKDYAPFFYKMVDPKSCRYYNNNGGGQISCDQTPQDSGRNRICKCKV